MFLLIQKIEQIHLNVKAATRNIFIELIMAAPVDKSGMSTTASCHNDLSLDSTIICFKEKERKEKRGQLCTME